MLLEPSEHMELEQLISDSCAWGDHGEAADWVLKLCTEGFTWAYTTIGSAFVVAARR